MLSAWEDPLDTNLLIGAFALLFGVATLIGRFVAPNSGMFSKLGPMKERFGDGMGTAIHVGAYTVMPLVVGVGLIASSYVPGQ